MPLTRRSFLQMIGLSPVVAGAVVSAQQRPTPGPVEPAVVKRGYTIAGSGGGTSIKALAGENVFAGGFVEGDFRADGLLVARQCTSLGEAIGVAQSNARAGEVVEVCIYGLTKSMVHYLP